MHGGLKNATRAAVPSAAAAARAETRHGRGTYCSRAHRAARLAGQHLTALARHLVALATGVHGGHAATGGAGVRTTARCESRPVGVDDETDDNYQKNNEECKKPHQII